MPDPRVRLTVLAGFLGSGKTTWLRHQLRHGVFLNARVIVNEAAALPLDDQLLRFADARVIAGGCACCDRLPDLLAVLRDEVDRPDAARIVLETSGLSDAATIRTAILSASDLDARLVVSEVLVAVDACHGLATLRTEELARRQVAAADALILTRMDEADPDRLAVLLATLQIMAPHAPMFGAAKGVETPLPDRGDALPEDITGDPNVRPALAVTLNLAGVADWPAFALWLSALLHARGAEVLRVKGIISSPAGTMLVQAGGGSVAVPERMPDDVEHADRVVVIGRGYTAAELEASLRTFGRM